MEEFSESAGSDSASSAKRGIIMKTRTVKATSMPESDGKLRSFSEECDFYFHCVKHDAGAL